MRFYSTLILCLFFSLAGAQDKCLKEFDGGYCLVKVNDDYGLKKKNKFIIPAFFDSIAQMGNEHFIAYQNGRKGVFDKKGKMVVRVGYLDVSPVSYENELFEVFNPGMRNIYITSRVERILDHRKVTETQFASSTEITVLDYLILFQYGLENQGKLDFDPKQMLPDTNLMNPRTLIVLRHFLNKGNGKTIKENMSYGWGSNITLGIELGDNFLLEKNNKDALKYPITGITYEQALMYCKIKSLLYNEELNPFKAQNVSIRFRLPKLFDWEEMAYTGLPNEKMKQNRSMDSVNVKGCQLFHFKFSFTCESITEYEKKFGKGMAQAWDYSPNMHGLYNVFGNTAEMTDEKGLCKGGSYFHYASESAIEKTLIYTKAEPWLGFRCFADLILTK